MNQTTSLPSWRVSVQVDECTRSTVCVNDSEVEAELVCNDAWPDPHVQGVYEEMPSVADCERWAGTQFCAEDLLVDSVYFEVICYSDDPETMVEGIRTTFIMMGG